MIRILIVDDSNVSVLILQKIFDTQDDIQVVGVANNGREAIHLNTKLKPDLITMDINMPVMDGFEATRVIMSTNPTPIVIISAYIQKNEAGINFKALEEGALAVLDKPGDINQPEFENNCVEIIETIRAMVEVKLVRRTHRISKNNNFKPNDSNPESQYKIIGLVSSTGGPQTLNEIFSSLPISFPVPIVVVQHISPSFINGLINWLQGQTLLKIKLATHNEILKSGCIYFAPDDYHLKITQSNGEFYSQLNNSDPVNRFRPSGTILLNSLSQACGNNAIAGILTGMGSDGAEGMDMLHKNGAHTFVQDEDSCIVYGMPSAALSLDCVDKVVPLSAIAKHILTLVN
ncbi:MAG: chemotaxis-specific protein-glutamate methyltransferase CheB [Bacteroidetes bacterium]|nr:chemotaxis-specific protein-glutamate methyltransferase CheB [Bacteroidota bacterium]